LVLKYSIYCYEEISHFQKELNYICADNLCKTLEGVYDRYEGIIILDVPKLKISHVFHFP